MSRPNDAPGRRVLTPAVTVAAAFATLSFLASVAFVSVRGGLQLPVAASATPGVAVASPNASSPPGSPAATPAASGGPSSGPTATPSPGASEGPPASPPPTTPPSGPPDPLLALPGCPDHPGCFLYTVHRGDSFTAVSDRYGLLLWITRALNPEVTNQAVITVGQTLHLGRDPTVRLDPCPDGAPCHLYPVRSGDTLSRIAGRYEVTVAAILELNPGLDPGVIVTGQVIRLPLHQG